MSNQLPQQPPVISGHVRVESRVAVWVECPICHREHIQVLKMHHHLLLEGLRLWRVDCQGVTYMVRVSSRSIATALDQAQQIADAHRLSQKWLSGEIVDGCPARSSAE